MKGYSNKYYCSIFTLLACCKRNDFFIALLLTRKRSRESTTPTWLDDTLLILWFPELTALVHARFCFISNNPNSNIHDHEEQYNKNFNNCISLAVFYTIINQYCIYYIHGLRQITRLLTPLKFREGPHLIPHRRHNEVPHLKLHRE